MGIDFMTLALANKYTDSKVVVGKDGREIELRKGETHIEWRYVGEEQWKQLVALSELKGAKGELGSGWLFGMNVPTNEGRDGDLYLHYTTFDVYKKTGGTWQKIDTIKGANGKNISLQKSETHIQWKVNDDVDTWHDLVALEEIKGEVTKEEIESQLIGNITTHEHNKYALTEHNHDNVYYKKAETYTKTETDTKIADEIAKVQVGGEVDLSAYATKEELKGKANVEHTHEGYAATEHNHDDVYSKPTHTHVKANITDFPTKLSQFENDLEISNGVDGREVELQKGETHIQWRYVGEDEWRDLIALADLGGSSSLKLGQGLRINESGELEYYFGRDLNRIDGGYAEGYKCTAVSEGVDYSEFFEWEDGNMDNEDRVGYFVTFESGKQTIRKANSNDEYIIGVVSASPSVIGDNYDEGWKGKYVRDDFGRLQYEIKEYKNEDTQETYRIEAPIISKEFKPEEIYQPRRNRKEWDAIGMLGKLIVKDDGTCTIGGFCKINDNGVAAKSDKGYYVMDRINDNVIKILFK